MRGASSDRAIAVCLEPLDKEGIEPMRMRIGRGNLAALLILATSILPLTAEAGGLGRAAARGAWRSSAKLWRRSPAQIMRRDLVRDRAIKARPLARPRTVFRYTSNAQARTELRRGIRPGRHMTSHGGPGRPLSRVAAQQRYGLRRRPQVRETIRLPKGEPIRSAKALGGRPGVGELTSTRRLSPTAITNVTH
jgi:hypothetical protein